MIKKIFILFILFIFTTPLSSYSEDNGVNIVAKNWFNTYSKKISIKNNIQNELIFFQGFSDKLNNILEKNKLNSAQKNLVKDLIKLSNEYVFNLELTEKEKPYKIRLNTDNLIKDFKYISYNEDNIFLENGIWYTYIFDRHLKFPDGTKISSSDLKFNNIFPYSTLVFLKGNNTLGFAIEYKKVKLITDSIIYGIPNKYNFLSEIKDDKKNLDFETDGLFENLKENSLKLSEGKNQSLKIKAIYDYILNNIEYPTTFSLSDPKIFSGIDTYKNNSGVCEGYTKMFMYMLNFANISKTEVVRGFVLDAQDFPKVGHAWVKIGDEYYDPTFDDPIGSIETKTYEKYNYYGLPKDLFYTNRYKIDEIPEYLKEKDLKFREDFITQNILSLLQKYKNSGYNMIKPYIIKMEKGIKTDKTLDLEDLKKIMGYYDVTNSHFIENGTKKYIATYNYYIVNDSLVETLLSQIDYNFDGFYLFKRHLDDGNIEYRLSYNVKVN